MLLYSILFQLGIASLLLLEADGTRGSGSNANSEKAKKVLVVAPNFLEVHFKMNSAFANVLTEDFYVHFLILNTKNQQGDNFNYGIDTKKFTKGEPAEGHNTYQVVDFEGYPEKLDVGVKKLKNKFLKRGYVQSYQILKNEAFIVFKDLFEKEKVIANLKNAKFDFGFFDTWDTGALFVFHAAKINNVFGINNTQLNAYQFEYASKQKVSQQEEDEYDVYPLKVPEIYSAKIGDSESKQQDFESHYEASSEIFKAVHEQLDEWYKPIYEKSSKDQQQKVPTTRDLYKEIKAIFLNGHELFDFPLGKYKPENVYYVGGIHLEKSKNNHENNHQKTQVIMSIEYCKQIAEDENKHILEQLLSAFDSVAKDLNLKFIYDCKAEEKDLKRLEVLKSVNHEIKKIPDMQEELAKGNTHLLITNCSGYQVIEAFHKNVQVLCLPFMVDQFYIAEALKLKHELEGTNSGIPEIGQHSNVPVFGQHKSPGNGSSSDSPNSRKTPNNKKHENIAHQYDEKFIDHIAPTLSFNLIHQRKKNTEIINELTKLLTGEEYKAKVTKVHKYLTQLPEATKEYFLKTVNSLLKKDEGGSAGKVIEKSEGGNAKHSSKM
ncbi:hypothetical protein ACQ4LE_006983, partial [Meloidogyne hapla]